MSVQDFRSSGHARALDLLQILADTIPKTLVALTSPKTVAKLHKSH